MSLTLNKLWTIVAQDTGSVVPPIDCNPDHGDQGCMVYFSREAATKAARHQERLYDIPCEACRMDKIVLVDEVE